MALLETLWPLFGLHLRTPRLVLRPLRDEDIPHYVDAAASGIYERVNGHIPFPTAWAESPELGPTAARWIWENRIKSRPESWTVMFGVWSSAGEFLGSQDVAAKNFVALRTVTTGSWLRRSDQGRGLGKEMRAAVLLWCFDFLGAEVAMTSTFEWNAPSIGVSRSLGYEPNGEARLETSLGVVEREVRFRLAQERFQRPPWELRVEGHEAAAAALGIPEERGGHPARLDGGGDDGGGPRMS
ncbi:GNAT family protein [Sinomonas sp. ASV486]|uniref:GNAT family N-acetyltransferase n=1 Tax=Sinomonas sp. ASV486 TaxID=3051170 RepID=UPI0027DAB7E7|nr:GNAT family protein [Sinomonas sp. ASV486]MDQ4490018.1 GNAT family protein [Sinomonas sp. ASV486]